MYFGGRAMSVMKQRFLLVSDMHYTTERSAADLAKEHPEAKASAAAGNAFGKTQRQKIEKIYEDILAENNAAKLDAVFVLGDLSIDDYDYRKLPFNYCQKLKADLMDRLPCPAYALPGNHDSYPNEIWNRVMGYDRKYSVSIGDCAFIMDDSFAAVPAGPDNPAGGAKFTPTDPAFLKNCFDQHKGKHIFYCSHYIGHAEGEKSFSDECKELLDHCGDLVFMYTGHTHVSSIAYLGPECGGKPVVDIGGYGYMGCVIDGRYDFNVFDEEWAWGYQILEIYDDRVKTYHVRTANHYEATNGSFDVAKEVRDVLVHSLDKK